MGELPASIFTKMIPIKYEENTCLEMHSDTSFAGCAKPFLSPFSPKSNRIIWLTVTCGAPPLYSPRITLPSALQGICNWSSFSSSSRWLLVPSWSSGLYRAVRILPNKTGFCCCRRNLRQIEGKDRKCDTLDGVKIKWMGLSKSHQTGQHIFLWVSLSWFIWNTTNGLNSN